MFGIPTKKNSQNIQSIIKLIAQTSEFKMVFESSAGDGEFKQTQCEDVSPPPNDDQNEENQAQNNYDDDQQFYLQGDEEQPEVGIKTCQFNSGMFAPQDNPQPKKIIKQKPILQLAKCFISSIGFNSKSQSTALLIQNQFICLGVGNAIVIRSFQRQQKSYCFQLGHTSEVTCLMYDRKQQYLYSGTSGLKQRPQIIQWNLKIKPNQIQMEELRRLYLPKKSFGIGSLILHKQALICIDEFSIHNNNLIYYFDLSQQTNRHKKQPIKLNAKLVDFNFEENQEFEDSRLITVTNSGTRSYCNLFQSNQEEKISDLKLSCVTKRDNGFICGTVDGFLWESESNQQFGPLHSGWIIKIKYLKYKGKQYLVSCGGDDRLLKISQINPNKWKQIFIDKKLNAQKNWNLSINNQNCVQIKARQYVTSISHQNQSNLILFALRDSSIIIFDLNTMKIKYEEFGNCGHELAYQKYSGIYDPIWHSLTGRILIPQLPTNIKKYDQFSGLNLIDPNISPKKNKIKVHIPAEFNCVCFSVHEDNLAMLLSAKKSQTGQNYYPLLIKSISGSIKEMKLNDKVIDQGMIRSEGSENKVWNKYRQNYSENNMDKIMMKQLYLDVDKVGKPVIIRLFDGGIVLGTSIGYLLVFDLNQNKLYCSTKKHKQRIEDIAYQINSPQSNSIKRFYKTISKDQLFYWEAIEKQSSFEIRELTTQKTKRLKQLKSVKWNRIIKYCWESKFVWESMTHYTQISKIGVLNNQFLLAAMDDGHLRVYNYPVSPANSTLFCQYKLFDGNFTFQMCSSSIFCVFSKGIFIFYEFRFK